MYGVICHWLTSLKSSLRCAAVPSSSAHIYMSWPTFSSLTSAQPHWTCKSSQPLDKNLFPAICERKALTWTNYWNQARFLKGWSQSRRCTESEQEVSCDFQQSPAYVPGSKLWSWGKQLEQSELMGVEEKTGKWSRWNLVIFWCYVSQQNTAIPQSFFCFFLC